MPPGAPTLIIHCQVFWPDNSAVSQMITAVAEDAVKQGGKVSVVTSARGYNLDELYPASEAYAGLQIHRVGGFRLDRHSVTGRLANYLSFALLSWLKILQLPRPDCLVVTSVPPFSLFIGWMAGILRKIPFVYVIEDLYPELAVASGVLKPGSLLARCAHRIFGWAMRRATEIIVVGEHMQRVVQQSHPRIAPDRIHSIHNWHDGRVLFPLPRQPGVVRPICFQYSGNLGEGHDFDSIAAAMEHFRTRADIRFEFVGRGKRRPYLEEQARQRALQNCTFSDYVPLDRLNESLNRADICIVTLKPGFEGLLVPSKIYGIMAVGRPVLYIGPDQGEIPSLIRNHQIGWIVPAGDTALLVAAIESGVTDSEKRSTYGRNARQAFDQHYDRPLATAKYLEVFGKAIRHHV